jgi:hypothetical protein
VNSARFGLIELLLVCGLLLALALWQWWDWRQWRKSRQRKSGDQPDKHH